MRHFNTLFIYLLLLFALQANAWTKLYPLKECSSFYLEYESLQTENGLRYQVRFPKNINYNDFDILDEKLENMSSLEKLNTEIQNRAPEFCEQLDLTNIDFVSCIKKENQNVLNLDFITFSKNILAFLPDEINSCDELYKVEFLGDEIQKLSSQEVKTKDVSNRLDFKLAKTFFKSQRETIDFFAKCGGKKFSQDFIRNMILIEAKNECIFPPPQGYLDFDQVLTISNNIAKDFNNKSLVDLNKEYDNIIKSSYEAFTKQSVKNTIAGQLGLKPYDKKIENILENSKEYKYLLEKFKFSEKDIKIKDKSKQFNNIKKIPNEDHLSEYISEVFSINLSFELAPQLINDMAEVEFINNLPNDFNLDNIIDEKDIEEKKKYLNSEVMPKIMANYKECIKSTEKYLAINIHEQLPNKNNIEALNYNDQLIINQRKTLKCNLHPNLCNQPEENSCNSNGYSYFEDPKINELSKIQGCGYKAITENINNIINKNIDLTLDALEIEQEIKYSDDFRKNIINKADSKFMSCLNNKVDQKNYETMKGSIYTDALKLCANQLTEIIGKDVINETILSMDILKTSYLAIYPEITDQEIRLEVENLSNKIYDRCMIIQNEIKTKDPKEYYIQYVDPLLCVPMIEMEISSKIVDNYIREKMIELKLISGPEQELELLTEFKNCKDTAINNSFNAIGNKKVSNPIVDKDSADNYLKENHEYFNCINNSIQKTVSLATSEMYNDYIDKNESVKDKKYAKSLNKEVSQLTTSCFKDKLNEIGSWSNLKLIFTKNNDENITESSPNTQHTISPIVFNNENVGVQKPKGGFDKILDDCAKNTEVFATSKILKNELNNELKPLIKAGLITQAQSNDVLTLSLNDLKVLYGIEVPNNLKQNEKNDFILKKILEFDQKNNGSTDHSLKLIEEKLTNYTLHFVRKDIFTDLSNYTQVGATKIKQFEDSMNLSCVKNLYLNLEKNSTEQNNSEITKEDRNKLMTIIGQGLNYLSELKEPAYTQKMNEIKTMCDKSKNITSIEELVKTNSFDFILKAQIKDNLYNQLKSGVDEYLITSLNSIDPNILKTLKNTLIANSKIKSSDALTADIINQYLTPELFIGTKSINGIKVKYALEQFIMAKKTIEKWIKDTKSFDQVMFNDKKVLDYAYANTSALLNPETSADKVKELSGKILEKLFEDRSKNSFASNFTESILLGGVGSQGIDSAVKSAGEQAADQAIIGLKTEAKNNAERFAKELWANDSKKNDSVESYLRFDQVDQSTRNSLIESIYKNAMQPSINGQSTNQKQITKDIENFTSKYKINGKTFEDKVSDYITPRTEAATKADAVRQITPIILPIMSPITAPIMLLF